MKLNCHPKSRLMRETGWHKLNFSQSKLSVCSKVSVIVDSSLLMKYTKTEIYYLSISWILLSENRMNTCRSLEQPHANKRIT